MRLKTNCRHLNKTSESALNTWKNIGDLTRTDAATLLVVALRWQIIASSNGNHFSLIWHVENSVVLIVFGYLFYTYAYTYAQYKLWYTNVYWNIIFLHICEYNFKYMRTSHNLQLSISTYMGLNTAVYTSSSNS